jgi:hypothetical protein
MNPQYLSTVQAGQFYKNIGTIDCPKCRLAFNLDTPHNILLASDVSVDMCPYCQTYVVINMTSGDSVCLEGYTDRASVDARVKELAGKSATGA